MKALIAFVVMALVILTLIEINERIKAKKPKDDCTREQKETAACEGCGLLEVCDKKPSGEKTE